MKYNKYIALGLSAVMTLGTFSSAFAAPMVVQRASSYDAQKKEQVQEKKVLTMEEAIKKAVDNNLNLKKFEITRESLLKQIDSSYRNDQSIFAVKAYQDSQLDQSAPDYQVKKNQVDAEFQRAMSGSDYVKAMAISQRSNIDVNTVMEREGVGISISRLFTSIAQKEDDIAILNKKIEQDKKNISLYEKQLALGKISASKWDELTLESTKNQNRLKVDTLKLSGYYRELENLTLLSNIQRDYKLEDVSLQYKPIDLSLDTQKAKEQSAADLSALVSSKTAAKKIAESKYDNYPYLGEDTTYVAVSDEKYLSQLEESQSIREAKANAQTKYNNLQELQENIEITKKDITKLENQLKDLKTKYSLGLISKNMLDNSQFALEEALNGLESLKTQHYQLRQMYENPYFAGV